MASDPFITEACKRCPELAAAYNKAREAKEDGITVIKYSGGNADKTYGTQVIGKNNKILWEKWGPHPEWDYPLPEEEEKELPTEPETM